MRFNKSRIAMVAAIVVGFAILAGLVGTRAETSSGSSSASPGPSAASSAQHTAGDHASGEKSEQAKRRLLGQLIEKNPDRAELYLFRAYQGGETTDLSKCIELKPDCAEAFYLRWRRTPARESLTADLDTAIRLNPHFYDALVDRAGTWSKSHLEDEISDLSKALQLNPYNSALASCRFSAYLRCHRMAEALQDYDRCRRRPLWTSSSAKFNWSPKMLEEIEAYRKRAGKKAMGSGRCLDGIIDLLDHGKAGRGLTALDRILVSNRKDTDACFLRAEALYLSHRLKAALEDLNRIIKIDGIGLQSGRLRAQVLLELKSYDRALADLDAVIAMSPGYALCYLARAQCYAGLKKEKEAGRAVLGYCMRCDAAVADVTERIGTGKPIRAHIDLWRPEEKW